MSLEFDPADREAGLVPVAVPAQAPAERAAEAPRPVIWAVASGQAGVGKSVLASSLSIALAASGSRTVAIDLDLGAANLHSLFGIERPSDTLAGFLRGELASLSEAVSPTPAPGVFLVSGAGAPLDLANPRYRQKLELVRQFGDLDAGHVVLDIGAGSSFDALDFFLAADRRLLVVTPEPTAIENAYHFLEAAFLRSLRDVASSLEVRTVVERVLDQSRRRGATPRELVEAVGASDPGVGTLLRKRAESFGVEVVVNRIERAEQRGLGGEISAAAEAELGAVVRCAGTLDSDTSVSAATARGAPVLQLFPDCAFSTGVRALADRLSAGSGALSGGPPLPRPRRAAGGPPSDSALPDGLDLMALPLPDFDGKEPGRHLRICRELLGLSLAQLSERTRIRHLARIEAERFDELPPEPYLTGFVRQYADALGISDVTRIAECFVARSRKARVEGSWCRR